MCEHVKNIMFKTIDMNSRKKIILSFGVIAVFTFIAIASIGPDGSTNTSVAIKDCEVKPPVNVKLNINIDVHWERVGGGTGNPVEGAFGKLFIVHQKVNSNDDCTYVADYTETIDFVCDQSGDYSFSGNTWLHDNAKDLIRVECLLIASALDGYGPQREVQVFTYDKGSFGFSFIVDNIL